MCRHVLTEFSGEIVLSHHPQALDRSILVSAWIDVDCDEACYQTMPRTAYSAFFCSDCFFLSSLIIAESLSTKGG